MGCVIGRHQPGFVYFSVAHGAGETGMAEEFLDGAEIATVGE